MARVRIGTCSWRFPSWHGLVYSAPEGIDYLREYARHYDTVEIDRWFWSLFGIENVGLPSPADVQAYRDAVSDDFRFTIKAPNSVTLTHFYRRKRDEPLVVNPHFLSASLFQRFLNLISLLQEVSGPVMLQFEYLNRQKMASQELFQEQLEGFANRIPSSHRYAIEVRNPQYLNEAYFQFLNRNRLIPVLLQGYWMPPITQVYHNWRSLILEQDVAVIRLLGPDRQGIEEETGKTWNEIVAPKNEELASIAEMVRDLEQNGATVYVNVNNHYEGSAPLTIDRLRQLL
jgi:uncharacterized protein YecE (DUF72 family)